MSTAKTRTSDSDYLLAGQASELERLQLQSRIWEPSGRRLLEEIKRRPRRSRPRYRLRRARLAATAQRMGRTGRGSNRDRRR